MTLTRKCSSALLSIVIIGCEQAGGGEGGGEETALQTQSVQQTATVAGGGQSYTSIPADRPGCLERVQLCEVLKRPSVSYGLYRIQRLTGYSEQTAQGVPKGVTHVSLERLGGPGPEAPVARIRGGPRPDGTYAPGPVSLRVGEVVGLVLHKEPSSEWYTFSTPDVFRQLQRNVFGNMYERFPGSEADFLKRLDLESRAGCPPRPPPPPSPEGMPAVITDYVDEEVVVSETD